MAVVNANRVTRVDREGVGNRVTHTERLGTVAWPDEPVRDKVTRVNPVARRGSKIVNAFVRKGHRGRHPGFAGHMSPVPGPGYRGKRGIRRKRY